jgi:hypothetical protein
MKVLKILGLAGARSALMLMHHEDLDPHHFLLHVPLTARRAVFVFFHDPDKPFPPGLRLRGPDDTDHAAQFPHAQERLFPPIG